MGQSWFDDSRNKRLPGRFEWRHINSAVDISTLAIIAPANPNRVALIVSAVPDTPTVASGVQVGVQPGATFIPLANIGQGRASVVLHFCEIGDAVWREWLAVQDGAGFDFVAVSELVYHPEGM